MKTAEKVSIKRGQSVDLKRVKSEALIKKLKEGQVKGTEKESIINILKNRNQDVTEFLPKQRGRKPILNRQGDSEFPRGTKVKFEVYRSPGQFMEGVVTSNYSSYVAKKSGKTEYLLGIRVEKDGKVLNISKNSRNVMIVKSPAKVKTK